MSEKVRTIDKETWQPKTTIGKMVKSGEIQSVEQIFQLGKPIIEPELMDILLPNMESETLHVGSTQRVTDSGKRMQFRIVVVIGDHNGHVGIGVGKSEEIKPALEFAIRDAKKNIISVLSGCGSWECKCNVKHSLTQKTIGKEGSTIITLKPAPRGLGLAGNDVVKKVLSMAGIKDVWSSSSGGRNTYNMAMAVIYALDNINKLKPLS
ncbi:30S ribosomal protein S5 [Candidatus Micrarchaeota archaeon]|nr:30S ribosomal protein S5 [Candidatus Micrarchaeota archaeon]